MRETKFEWYIRRRIMDPPEGFLAAMGEFSDYMTGRPVESLIVLGDGTTAPRCAHLSKPSTLYGFPLSARKGNEMLGITARTLLEKESQSK